MAIWYPHVTVATIVQQQDEFLVVEELADNLAVINQPAGHVEEGETLFAAAIRETLEETGYEVRLTGLVGFYYYRSQSNNITYQRCCFAAQVLKHRKDLALDRDIIAPHWMTLAALRAHKALRSPLVLRCIEDYLHRPAIPLDYLYHHPLKPTEKF